MSAHVFIELTPLGVKAAVATGQRDKFILKQLRWHPFTDGWDAASPVKTAAWVKSWIPRGTTVTLLVPRPMALVRVLNLPSQDEEELRRMVALQLGEYIPYGMEEVVWDMALMSPAPNGYSRVMVWVAAQKDLMRWIDPLEQAGIKCAYVTLNVCGISRRIEKGLPGVIPNRWQLVLDIDAAHTECVFVKDNHQLFLRALNFGWNHLQTPADAFIKELVMTIKEFLRDHPQETLDHISVISAAPLPAWFGEWCQRQSFVHEAVDGTKIASEKKFSIPPAFTQEGVSLTAISGLLNFDQKPWLNLMPPMFKQQQEAKLQKRLGVEMGICLAVSIVLVILTTQIPLLQMRLQIAHLQDVVDKQQKQVRNVDKLRLDVEAFKGATTGRAVFARIAQVLEKNLGDQIFLNTLGINPQRVLSLEGYGREGVDLDGLQSRLTATGLFSDVNLDYVNKRVTQEGQLVYFRLTMSIKAKEE